MALVETIIPKDMTLRESKVKVEDDTDPMYSILSNREVSVLSDPVNISHTGDLYNVLILPNLKKAETAHPNRGMETTTY